MQDYFSRINKNTINPIFLSLVEQLLKNCAARGVIYYAISGTRTPEQQAALYAQGRSTPGKIVTNAQPFSSLHQFGLAMDFCKDLDMTKEGLQPSWNIADYEVLAEEARKLGLVCGMDFKTFKEGPHIQYATKLSLKELKELYLKDGLEKVWQYV